MAVIPFPFLFFSEIVVFWCKERGGGGFAKKKNRKKNKNRDTQN